MERTIGNRFTLAFRKYSVAYLFILGPVLLTVIFLFIPLVSSFIFSLTEWSGIHPPKFIGLQNYEKLLFHDRKFYQALINTTIFVLLGQGIGPILGLFSAIALNQKIKFRICRIPCSLLSSSYDKPRGGSYGMENALQQ